MNEPSTSTSSKSRFIPVQESSNKTFQVLLSHYITSKDCSTPSNEPSISLCRFVPTLSRQSSTSSVQSRYSPCSEKSSSGIDKFLKYPTQSHIFSKFRKSKAVSGKPSAISSAEWRNIVKRKAEEKERKINEIKKRKEERLLKKIEKLKNIKGEDKKGKKPKKS